MDIRNDKLNVCESANSRPVSVSARPKNGLVQAEPEDVEHLRRLKNAATTPPADGGSPLSS